MAEAIRRPAKKFSARGGECYAGRRGGAKWGPRGDPISTSLFPSSSSSAFSILFSSEKEREAKDFSSPARLHIDRQVGRGEGGAKRSRQAEERKGGGEKASDIFLNRDSASPVGDEGRRATPYPDFKRCRRREKILERLPPLVFIRVETRLWRKVFFESGDPPQRHFSFSCKSQSSPPVEGRRLFSPLNLS